MSDDEKSAWTTWLWVLSLAFTLNLGIAVGLGDFSIQATPFPILAVFTVAIFTWWLFRITYLAGRKRR